MLSGTRVVSSGAPSPFNRIHRSRCMAVVVGLVFKVCPVEDVFDVIRHFCVDGFVGKLLRFRTEHFLGSFLQSVQEFVEFLFCGVQMQYILFASSFCRGLEIPKTTFECRFDFLQVIFFGILKIAVRLKCISFKWRVEVVYFLYLS